MTALARLLPLVLIPLCAAPLAAQTTTRVSVDSAGTQGSGDSEFPSISSDGRYVAFTSLASTLAAGAAPGRNSVFVHDRRTGQTVCASVGLGGADGTGSSLNPKLSSDGTHAAFWSDSSNLVVGDTNGLSDVFVRNLVAGTTTRVSVSTFGVQGNGGCGVECGISANGMFVAFQSFASNLVSGTPPYGNLFVHEMATGLTTFECLVTGGAPISAPAISADGRFVVFDSFVSILVPNDTNSDSDIFLRDRQTAQLSRVSVGAGGVQGNNGSFRPALSPDGRWLVFDSMASNLVAGDTNGWIDVFRRDLQSGQNLLVSRASNGMQGVGFSSTPSITDDGRFVAFTSLVTTLVAGDTNSAFDAFVHDCLTGETVRVSLTAAGGQNPTYSENASISGGGRLVAFNTPGALVSADTNGSYDVYVRDQGTLAGTLFCTGDGSQATACPCGNNGSTGRGCGNSAAPGGAQLSINGFADDPDQATLHANGIVPGALTIFVQGNAQIAGVTFGDGVRCVSGVLNRMYVANASGGIANAPTAGSLPVGQQSIYLEDPIVPGTSRWYQAWYRDGDTSFCAEPQGGLFNLTNGVRVDW